MKDFSDYLRSERIKAGLSQAAVAKKLGYSTSQFISNWERGLVRPPLKAIKKLISIYKLNIDVVVDLYMQRSSNSLRNALARASKSGRHARALM